MDLRMRLYIDLRITMYELRLSFTAALILI